MKRTFTLSTLFAILFTTISFAQNELKVINPDWGWGNYGVQGTIEEAEFQIEPKGLYMEVGMFLTFSAQGTSLEGQDGIEIVFDFNLPAGSIVHDSWLWMNDTLIVQADILDISQATAVYEDIVDRNLDPSLLYRKENGTYQLRIFPLQGGESRKVKVTFLTPTIWNEDKVEAWLPLEFLENSEIPLTTFNIISIADDAWGEPTLSGAENVEFESVTDPDAGDIWFTSVEESNFSKPIKFALESPLGTEGTFVSKFEDENEDNFYQVVYVPPVLPSSLDPKNVAIVFDHDADNSNIDKEEIFNFVKQSLESNLKEEDHLNLFYSNNSQVDMASDTWVSCDSSSLAQLFSNLTDPIGISSNFVETVTTSIEFVLQNNEAADIILLTNSSESFSYSSQVESWVEMIGGADVKIHIVNYQTLNYWWDEGWNAPPELWFSHKNLYEDLSLSTGGSLVSSLESGVNTWEAISNTIGTLKNSSYSFDLDVDIASGFSYAPFYQTYQGQSSNLNQPILQVGKYLGDFPMTLEFSAYNDGVFVFDSVTIESANVNEWDSLGREIWTGHLIRSLEGSASNDIDVQNIVDISLEERVLSKYTAFLALELAQGGEPCIGCWYFDEPIVITTEEVEEELGVDVSISPNPFSDYCQIRFELLGDEKLDDLKVHIFDTYGNVVSTLNTDELLYAGSMQLNWEGKDSNGRKLPAGIYHLIVQTKQQVASFKLVLIK